MSRKRFEDSRYFKFMGNPLTLAVMLIVLGILLIITAVSA